MTTTLERALRAVVGGEVRFDAGSRAAYATDASNFRQVPVGVVVPSTVEEGAAAVGVCAAHDVPVLSRGGGTSLAGQCTNAGVVVDWSKYCNQLLSVDPDARTCVVEPGIVLDDLNGQLAGYGLRFGPEPATHMNCTLGGMIGNNSCGATAQRTGKVVDNVAAMEVLLYDGTRFWCGETSDEQYREIERHGDRRAAVYRALRRLRDEYGEEIRRRFPDIPRRVSGYNLDSLLPEHGFDVAGLLVGSESTLVTVLRAELELVPVQAARTLVILGYRDIARAGDAVPTIVRHDPVALEGVDHYLVHDQWIKSLNTQTLEQLPQGTGFLMVQFGGDSTAETDAAAQRMLDDLAETPHDPEVRFLDEPANEDEMWQVREAGLGATANVPHRPDTFEGWEDSAVPPERLGDYLRDLRRLYEEFGYASDSGPALYGHFGQGCVHTRIPFDLYTSHGVATYRHFMERAADLVVAYGGSFSGEHGDGQSRGELLPRMFGGTVMRAFGELKQVFDPRNRMNPGKVVEPYRLDDNLRLGAHWSPTAPRDLYFSYPQDDGSFVQAANRCVGVGRCRQTGNGGGEVMCPSYQATGEEEHTTRGRARLLFEMLNGHGDGPITDGWRSTEVRDALDLCLACKGCKSDCPADVDMATYKAEFLAHHYAGRLRPRADYALGWLPVLARAVAGLRAGPVVNAVTHAPGVRALGPALAGLEHREIPVFAPRTLQQWWAPRGPRGGGERGEVLLWPDTFTNSFHPHVGQAAVEVLESAGWRVTVPTEPVCCGLTWISTGQLATARRVLGRTVRQLADHVQRGGYVVGLEPSCTAVFRNDAPELLSGDQDVARLRDQTVTLAELLADRSPGWSPRQVGDVEALAQVHCHQHAVMGWDADARLLAAAGVDVERLESGCCGLAGNFGFTRGHGEVSEACAERVLLPRLRDAERDTVVLADGFSCRTQIHQLDSGDREAVHLAELLAADGAPQEVAAWRPADPGPVARSAALVGLGAAAGAAGVALARGPARRPSGSWLSRPAAGPQRPGGGPRGMAVIESVECLAYTIPTDAPEADGTLAWDSTTMVVSVVRSGGTEGTGWTYAPPAAARVIGDMLGPVVVGHDPMAVPGVWTAMVRSVRNATRAGVAGYALSAVDVACWDLKARLLGVSLVDLFGVVHREVPVYGSGGFTCYPDERTAEQLTSWVAGQGIPRVKIKVGVDRGSDVERVHLARDAIGPRAELFVDANGAYSAKQAVRVLGACVDAGVSWYEEPVSSDDLRGLRFVRDHVDADVTAGEYGSDVGYFQRMCAAGAVDCLQVDATRCGGYTEWLRAAAVAQSHELTVSGHCAPHLHAPVASATPNMRHLEWFHDHVRIETMAFDGTLDPTGGAVTPDPTAPGHGLTLRRQALEPYRVNVWSAQCQ